MNAIDQFKTGDLVTLKSGSPLMTVGACIDVNASDATGMRYGIHCSWMSDNGHPQMEVYHPAMLQLKRNDV